MPALGRLRRRITSSRLGYIAREKKRKGDTGKGRCWQECDVAISQGMLEGVCPRAFRGSMASRQLDLTSDLQNQEGGGR
jgi:hypothetical protein